MKRKLKFVLENIDSVAQQVEHIPFKDGVLGSNPSWITNQGGKLTFSSFFVSLNMFIVYILYSKSIDRYYIGYTNDLQRRLTEHNRIKGKYTDTGIPWEVVYTETFQSRLDAHRRELFIKKKKSKSFIIELINCR